MNFFDRWPILLFQLLSKSSGNLSLSDSKDISNHLDSAYTWLCTSKSESLDGGIPTHYDILRNKWKPSYPETTGYLIPTLINYSVLANKPQALDMAISLAEYLLTKVTPEGGVSHWKTGKNSGKPIVFDTGQVIFGFIAAWKASGENKFFNAAEKAAVWLVEVQEIDGSWINEYFGKHLVIDARVSWALLEVAKYSNNKTFIKAARSNLEWALSNKQSNYWFRLASFNNNEDPSTHTIAYVARGFLESGVLLDCEEYLDVAKSIGYKFLELQKNHGTIHGYFNPSWEPTSKSVCLTGICQIALLWLRLYTVFNEFNFVLSAYKALEFVASKQNINTTNENIYGGIPGSFPIYGKYERFKYPNWSVKFFMDALSALYNYNHLPIAKP